MSDPRQDIRQRAHARLDELIDLFEGLERADDLTQRVAGMNILAEAAAFAGSIAGAENLIRIYGGASQKCDRGKLLELLGRRLSVASHLFRSIWTGDGYSVEDAASEAVAIAKGDCPRLFAQIAPKKVPARAATHRLRALEWDVYLEARGESVKARHAKIIEAFGVSSWDVIRKWPPLIIEELGEDAFNFALADARHAGAIAKTGGEPAKPTWRVMQDWTRDLKNDGRRLLAELKARAEAR